MLSLPCVVISFLLCAASTTAQDKHHITVEYDRFRDSTFIGLEPMKTSNAAVQFFALFECPGRNPCRPEVVVFGFAILNLYEEPYQGKGIARAIRDGVRQDPYEMKYLGKKTRITVLPADVFMARLRIDSVGKIANSKVVEYQIDSTEFTFTPENLAALRALTARMQPSNPSQ